MEYIYIVLSYVHLDDPYVTETYIDSIFLVEQNAIEYIEEQRREREQELIENDISYEHLDNFGIWYEKHEFPQLKKNVYVTVYDQGSTQDWQILRASSTKEKAKQNIIDEIESYNNQKVNKETFDPLEYCYEIIEVEVD